MVYFLDDWHSDVSAMSSVHQDGLHDTPQLHASAEIGIIGMGEMGRMYADRLYRGGYKQCAPSPCV
jgi:phosphoglycerate dehydrogenase-like enzyme